ncbi:hypothetical protein RN51_00164 [Microbacterium oxydans]|uniref:Uncharacterized protein n=1 Tax=Microbacterium oxydans TaxID=82380 RepID=A0A0F0L042_9MICO|nr:hypothetical protein RN51_00164 [Microbacterium oxydans]
MRSDKLARNYRGAICLAATLIWIKTDSITTAIERGGEQGPVRDLPLESGGVLR